MQEENAGPRDAGGALADKRNNRAGRPVHPSDVLNSSLNARSSNSTASRTPWVTVNGLLPPSLSEEPGPPRMMLKQLPSVRGARAVVPHVDDLGASHGANRAFLDLAARGLVTCGWVMVPGPWFREIAEAAGADPALDLGVHLTLTSEWSACRWAPISTVPHHPRQRAMGQVRSLNAAFAILGRRSSARRRSRGHRLPRGCPAPLRSKAARRSPRRSTGG